MQNAKISKPPRFTLRLVLPRLTQTHFQHLQHLHVRHFTLLFNLRIHRLVELGGAVLPQRVRVDRF